MPQVFNLYNYPNPFNPQTTIEFTLPQAENVQLSIYNTIGQLISIIINEQLVDGLHTIQWNAEQQNSGLYIYKLTTSSRTEIGKMLYIK